MGLKLEDKAVSIAVGLRIGAPIVSAHRCACGQSVGEDGTHGLSCRRSAGRQLRHQLLNDILHRTLQTAGVPAVREPTGLIRGDGKRPDGGTLIPWSHGKTLIWDATCPDTFAASHVAGSAIAAGSAADKAETLKTEKYSELALRHHFVPFAIETSGSWGSSAQEWTKEIGKRLLQTTGDIRAPAFFRQRISVAVQKGNAVSVLGTFDEENKPSLDEHIYNIPEWSGSLHGGWATE